MRQISSEIEIEAPAERVWNLLTDFSRFPEWNPFIRKATGQPKVGERLEVNLQPSGARNMTFKPRVLKAESNRELRWVGRLLIPGLFTGEHSFTIEQLDGKRVRFVQSERFTGLLVPLSKGLVNDARRGFQEMNQALKERAEQSEA